MYNTTGPRYTETEEEAEEAEEKKEENKSSVPEVYLPFSIGCTGVFELIRLIQISSPRQLRTNVKNGARFSVSLKSEPKTSPFGNYRNVSQFPKYQHVSFLSQLVAFAPTSGLPRLRAGIDLPAPEVTSYYDTQRFVRGAQDISLLFARRHITPMHISSTLVKTRLDCLTFWRSGMLGMLL